MASIHVFLIIVSHKYMLDFRHVYTAHDMHSTHICIIYVYICVCVVSSTTCLLHGDFECVEMCSIMFHRFGKKFGDGTILHK